MSGAFSPVNFSNSLGSFGHWIFERWVEHDPAGALKVVGIFDSFDQNKDTFGKNNKKAAVGEPSAHVPYEQG
jgi:hypothetical protein